VNEPKLRRIATGLGIRDLNRLMPPTEQKYARYFWRGHYGFF
jgi:hypothetical protein